MSGVVGAQIADGRYLARTENILALDGAAPKAIAIISFDSEAKAKAYYENSKDLTSARMKVGTTRSFISYNLFGARGTVLRLLILVAA